MEAEGDRRDREIGENRVSIGAKQSIRPVKRFSIPVPGRERRQRAPGLPESAPCGCLPFARVASSVATAVASTSTSSTAGPHGVVGYFGGASVGTGGKRITTWERPAGSTRPRCSTSLLWPTASTGYCSVRTAAPHRPCRPPTPANTSFARAINPPFEGQLTPVVPADSDVAVGTDPAGRFVAGFDPPTTGGFSLPGGIVDSRRDYKMGFTGHLRVSWSLLPRNNPPERSARPSMKTTAEAEQQSGLTAVASLPPLPKYPMPRWG